MTSTTMIWSVVMQREEIVLFNSFFQMVHILGNEVSLNNSTEFVRV